MEKLLKNFIFIFFLIFCFSAEANVIGSDAQNFNPTTSGLDFVTVQSSETLEPGILNLGLFINHAVNTLPYFPNLGTGLSQSRTDFNDSFTSGDFNFGLGLIKNWDIGLSFPVLLAQDVDNTNGVGLYKEGLTEVRLNTKYRLWGDQSQGLALIATINFNRIKNNPFAGKDAGPTTNLELAYDRTFGKWALGANLGYRMRDSGDAIPGVPIDPISDQVLASVAGSYLLNRLDTKLIFEIYSAFSKSNGNNQSDRDLSSTELIAGAKHDLNSHLALHMGAGTEINHGASAPDWRIYAGINWTMGPLWKEKAPEPKPVEKAEFVDPQGQIKLMLQGLKFVSGTDELVPESQEVVDSMLDQIKKITAIYKLKSVEIMGHTDSLGSAESNMQLSQLRADKVKKILVEKAKVSADIIKAVGYGETQPIADNGNYQGRAQNRRVEANINIER